MKKRYVILMLACLSLAIVGCGKKESSDATIENVNEGIENVVEDDTYEDTEDITSSADETDNKVNEEIDDGKLESDLSTLGGVYMRADELIDVPIGLYSDGTSKNLCNVSVPKNYYIYIQDTDDDGIKRDNFEIGGSKVAEAIENGLYDLKHPIEELSVDTFPDDNTYVSFKIYSADATSFNDEMQPYITNKVDFADNIYYYLDGTSPYTADIFVRYDISDDFYVRIDYDGPLSEELNTDELIQYLCNLVEVLN